MHLCKAGFLQWKMCITLTAVFLRGRLNNYTVLTSVARKQKIGGGVIRREVKRRRGAYLYKTVRMRRNKTQCVPKGWAGWAERYIRPTPLLIGVCPSLSLAHSFVLVCQHSSWKQSRNKTELGKMNRLLNYFPQSTVQELFLTTADNLRYAHCFRRLWKRI